MNILQMVGALFQSSDSNSPLPVSRRLSETGISVGPYELCIPQGLPRSTGHVLISHRQQYTILLKNQSGLRCDAKVAIDDKVVGHWRIPAWGKIEVEHPVDDAGRFTFYMLGSPEARQIGLIASESVGLVTVTFMPELPPKPVPEHSSGISHSPKRGGTGLSGESAQRYSTVAALNYDRNHFVTINARLYCDDGAPRPLRSAGSVVPTPLP